MTAEVWAGFVLGLVAGLAVGTVAGVMLMGWIIAAQQADRALHNQRMCDRIAGKCGEDKTVQVHL